MKSQSQNPKLRGLIGVALGLITLALYLPALHHGFVEYDDQQYVTDNPRVQAGLTWAGLIWAFGFHAGNWHPLAWLSHMLDCQLFGARAWGHHLTSILLHVATTLLLFSVLNRMTRLRSEASAPQASLRANVSARPADTMWRSAAVAALFAWHPLHVESVAWVAERKDVLCAFFWMLTLWCYVRYVAKPCATRYLLTLGSFILCLMAKPMGVTLPFVLLLLDYWPLARIQNSKFKIQNFKALLVEKVPFLVLSAGACVLTMSAQDLAIVSTSGLPVSDRITHVLAAYHHYLVAMFVPQHLAVYYPYEIHLPLLTIASAAGVLGLITWLALKNIRCRPYIIVGWLWFLGTLVPVIGLVQVGDQAWADRYTYLPLIGLFISLVWFVGEAVQSRGALKIISAGVAVLLLAATSLQLGHWKNTRILFTHADKVTTENYMAVTVLGSLLAKEGKLDQAMQYYQRALRYKPGFPEAHFFLGNALDEQGKPEEAVAEYEKALWFRPTQEQTHIFMGIALGKQKKYDEAIVHYTAALKLNPDSAVTHNNLARIFHTQGRLDEAITHYTAALEIDPKLALAHNNLGILLLQKGDHAGGIAQLREALHVNPTNAETQFNLALALNQQQQWSEAAELFKKTADLHRADPKAHCEYAVALAHLKRTREAMSEYAAAILLQPDFPDALDGLAWILSTDTNTDFRNGTEAVKMAERACALTGRKDPVKLKTLAAAYAESGRFEEAVATAQSALDLADHTSRKALADECRLMLKSFSSAKPWR